MAGKRCVQLLSDGTQCGAWALQGKDFCFSHDPESREAKLEACRTGGLVKEIELDSPLEPMIVTTPLEVVFLLSKTIDEVRSGKLDCRIANSIAYLSTSLLKAFELATIDAKAEQAKEIITQIMSDRRQENIYGR